MVALSAFHRFKGACTAMVALPATDRRLFLFEIAKLIPVL